MKHKFLQISLIFIFAVSANLNLFAQLTTPEVQGIYGGRINCISVISKNSDTSRVFISTESANSIFYTDVYSGSGAAAFGTFSVMPGLDDAAGYGSSIQRIAADSASGYLFFIHQTGLLSSHPSSSTVTTVSSGNINALLVYRSNLFFIKNSTEFHYGSINTSTGAYAESGSVTITSTSNPSIIINKSNNKIYVFGEGSSPVLVKSSSDYNAFTGATTFSSIALALSPSLFWKAFGIGPDGKLFIGGASSGKSVANSTDDGATWTTVSTGITGTFGPNIDCGGTSASYYVYFASCYSSDKGATWNNFGNVSLETHSNDGTNIVDPNKSSLVYLTSDQGIAASTNSGPNIFEIDNGVEAVQVNDCDMNSRKTNAWIASKSGIRKVYDYNTSSPVWSNAMFPNGDGSPYYSADMNINDTSTAYVGNVRVYKTTNNGSSWNRVFTAEDAPYSFASSSVVEAIEVCPCNSNIVMAGYSQTGTSKGGLFYSTNAGTNWNQILIAAASVGQDVDVNDIVFSIEGTDTVAYVGVSYDLSSPQGVALYRLTKSGDTWTPAQNMDGTHTTVGYQIVATIIDLCTSVTGDTVYACGTDAGVNHPIAYYKVISGTNKWSAFSVTGFPITPGMQGKAITVGPDSVFVAADNKVYYLTGNYSSATWVTGYTYPVGTQINVLYYDELLVGTGTGLYGQAGYAILPVEFSSFNSSVSGTNVTLSWKTQSEQNNAGYDVERKSSSGNWNNIAFIDGKGTTNQENVYSFTDKNLATGTYSYRLKQIDYNGTSKYYYLSNEVIIGVPDKFILSQNYPNPFNPVTKINFELPVNTNVRLAVFDVSGRMVLELIPDKFYNAGYYSIDFNASNLSSGIYFYKLTTDKFTSVKKMVLIK